MDTMIDDASIRHIDSLTRYNVIWDTPSDDCNGSMPIGNGEMGLNVWVEPNGDVLLLIGRTDSWDENERLCKIGRVRICCTPSLLPGPFRQTLDLANGQIEIFGGPTEAPITIHIWPDANHPVARVEATSPEKFSLKVSLELWRTSRRPLQEGDGSIADECHGVQGTKGPKYSHPDVVVPNQERQIVWYHRNPTSPWKSTLERQQLHAAVDSGSDPLLHRTFGGLIRCEGLAAAYPVPTLAAVQSQKQFNLHIHTHTLSACTELQWLADIEKNADAIEQKSDVQALVEHRRWWANFWSRSWIFATGNSDAHDVTRGYILQRFINAGAGRGNFPIKFNGSIFNVSTAFDPGALQHIGDAGHVPQLITYDPDFRRWGGGYWFQNTRLVYWPMLAAGDFDMMGPLFEMYRDVLPLSKVRSEIYFNHSGAFLPETISFWGTYINGPFGWAWDEETLRDKDFAWPKICEFIRHHFNGTLELVALLIDYYAHTKNEEFLQKTLLPMAEDLLAWWEHHWPRDEHGIMQMQGSSSLETYWGATNPAPDIAGLIQNLDRLLRLSEQQLSAARQSRWERLQKSVPQLPRMVRDNRSVLAPAEQPLPERTNFENPELYAVFPYRLFGIGKPELQLAIDTFNTRQQRGHNGWFQDETQAAYLGLTEAARDGIVKRAREKHPQSRFPAFWGPNFDWVPDQDHGGNLMMAFQTMLMQADDGKIQLLPAWPSEWDVEFKLHAPGQTVVQGRVRSGVIEFLTVTPNIRRADVISP